MTPFTFYQTPPVLLTEQDQFEDDIRSFKAGEIDPVKFKAIRVAHGVYEQRQPDTYMIRIRCAAGGITPAQLKCVADLGRAYGSGDVHFTTRQEVQVHDVLIDGVMSVIRGLNAVGLSSRGGGGNTIRAILTSPDSGISNDDVFDVDPYAMALTTRMIFEPDSWNLPRKFKIAFSNNGSDTAFTQATCLGFVAKIQDGQKGFSVYCAGGMGAKPMVGHCLFDFIPDTQVYHVTKAMKLMFDENGNRRNRNANRLKFLWAKLDREEFTRLFMKHYLPLKDDMTLALTLPVLENTAKATDLPVISVSGSDYDIWKRRYVTPQKQPGLVSIKVPLVLGDLLTEDAHKLCDFLAHFGENTIRCDRAQNMRLRNVPEAYLGNLYTIVMGMAQSLATYAPFIGNMINCTGASTCKLGICLPRGLSTAIRDRLANSELNLDAISDFKLNMSGCPNTCGMHHIADLGFFGKVGRKNGDLYPAYNVLAGAVTGEAGQTQYAQKVNEIAAKHVPNFVHDFLEDYIKKMDQYGGYRAYLESEGIQQIHSLCEKYSVVPDYDIDPSFYTDWGASARLSLEQLGKAECSAGMFDMIEVDEKAILAAKRELVAQTDPEVVGEVLYKLAFSAARMLLVTRGLDVRTDTQAFELFAKHFIETELVSPSYADVLVLAKLKVFPEMIRFKDKIIQLGDDVIALYKSMDDSLKFHAPVVNSNSMISTDTAVTTVKDFRGVACPMNFVKTKMALETLKSGDHLEIWLDDGQPIENVPNSVKSEGHTILRQVRDDNFWKVVIQKA